MINYDRIKEQYEKRLTLVTLKFNITIYLSNQKTSTYLKNSSLP
jgi:hypothetical protein